MNTHGAASAKRIRVLHCITHLALGGAEEVAFSVMRGLSSHFEFALFTSRDRVLDEIGQSMRDELQRLAIQHYHGTRLDMKLGGFVLAGVKLRKAIDDFRPDIVHVHTEIPEATYAAMTAFSPAHTSPVLVRTIHNSIYWSHWRALGRWSERQMCTGSIAAVSADAADALRSLHREANGRVEDIRPTVIPNGVGAAALPFREPRANPSVIRVLFAGRFEPQKGADLLPEILARTPLPAGKTIELSILGSGSLRPRLKALSASPPAGWNVQVLPPLANLRTHLGEFELLLMPSRFEGLPLLAIEAQLAGLPVIATDAPGLRDAMPPEHPWLAAAGDAQSFALKLNTALNAPASWLQSAQRSREYALQRFSAEVMCERYAQFYQETLGTSRAAHVAVI